MLGATALSLLEHESEARQTDASLLVKSPHFKPQVKRVIFLSMLGGPSQLELFDNKPQLRQRQGQPIPKSLLQGQRFAFIKGAPSLVGSRYRFRQHGETGSEISELLPHLSQVADDITIVRSMHTEAFNHDPAMMFLNTGSQFTGRPAMGSWLTYGLGSESKDLPGFVVLASGEPDGPPVGYHHWNSGFLPTVHQGVRLRSSGDSVMFLSNPPGVSRTVRRQAINAIGDLNRLQRARTNDAETATRTAAFEMAFRMQRSVPELTNLKSETSSTLQLYGADPSQPSFANNCLLARRLVERGVRFVQLYHRHWDHHGFDSKNQNIWYALPRRCREIDQPAAALLRDLKQRGLLDETLVVWAGEFGRTPMVQGSLTRNRLGRDHHPRAFSIWMAGGGLRPGTFGATDELGYNVTDDSVHIHDLHATMLHLLGLDHERLVFRHLGRPFRLTDVAGRVVKKLLV